MSGNQLDKVRERQSLKSTPAIVMGAVALVSGIAVRRAIEAGWEQAYGEKPPKNPSDAEVGWKQALVWGGLLGLLTGVARVAARKGTVKLWGG